MSRTREPLKPVYAIGGDDRPKVERAVRRLAGRVTADGGMPPETLAASDTPAAHVVAACEALGFGGARLVIVPDAHVWRADDVTPLVAYLQDPNPATCLALVHEGALPQKLLTAVASAGDVLAFGPPAGAKARDRTAWFVKHVADEAKRHGATLSPALARQVVQMVGEDATALSAEAEKLAAYAGDAPVTKEMVQEIVVTHPDAAAWDLTDALAARTAARVYDVLQDFTDGDNQRAPIAVAGGLARHYRAVAAAQSLGTDATPDRLGELCGVKGFPAQKAIEHARALPEGAGERAVARVAQLELDLRVSAVGKLGRFTGDGPRFVLELAARDLLRLADPQ